MRFEAHKGNCLDVLTYIETGSVDMVFADLPYGTTACGWDSIIPLEPLWRELLRVAKENAALVFTAQQPFTWKLCASRPDLLRYSLVWEKPNGTSPYQAKVMPMKKHEDILVFYREKPVYNPQMEAGRPYKWNSRRTKGEASSIRQGRPTPIDNPGVRYPGSVLKFKQERGLHPTQKPVALVEWLVRTYTHEGGTVLDPTMGSGTTGVAALKAGRTFVGIERDEDHFATARRRLEGLDPGRAA